MTDPIADMLTRIRNAIVAGHKSAVMPSSTIKTELAKIMKETEERLSVSRSHILLTGKA